MTKEPNIGHDPLAWMAEEKEEFQKQSVELPRESENQPTSKKAVEAELFDVDSNSPKDKVESSEKTEGYAKLKSQDSFPIDVSTTSKSIDTTTHEVIQVSEKGEWITIHLPANITLPHLDDLQAQLHDFSGQRIHFSAENVQRVDTAALQLLVSFIKENKDIRWGNPSRALYDAANLLSLSTYLNLPTSLVAID